jgi:hypothetical protein
MAYCLLEEARKGIQQEVEAVNEEIGETITFYSQFHKRKRSVLLKRSYLTRG